MINNNKHHLYLIACHTHKSYIELTTSVIYRQVVWFACGQANSHLNILKHFSHIPLPTEFCCDKTVGILLEARKYRLCLSLAHQSIGQLDERLSKAIFGNVGTIITFPIGAENGESLEKHFYPEFNRQDLINHGKHHLYLTLAIDSKTSNPFSAITLPPFYNFKPQGNEEKVIAASRSKYAGKRKEIEREIEG